MPSDGRTFTNFSINPFRKILGYDRNSLWGFFVCLLVCLFVLLVWFWFGLVLVLFCFCFCVLLLGFCLFVCGVFFFFFGLLVVCFVFGGLFVGFFVFFFGWFFFGGVVGGGGGRGCIVQLNVILNLKERSVHSYETNTKGRHSSSLMFL